MKRILIVATAVVLVSFRPASSKQLVIAIPVAAAQMIADADTSLSRHLYLAPLAFHGIPSNATLVELEITFDVTHRVVEAYSPPQVTIEVAPLLAPLVELTVSPQLVGHSLLRKRIDIGQRKVSLDITSVFRHWQGGAVNCGVLVGAISGERLGKFEHVSESGLAGQLKIYYRGSP